MDTSANEYLKGAIEALLFISEKPVPLDQLTEVIQEGVGVVDVRKLVTQLQEEYEAQQRGMVIVEIAGGYQMLSSSHYVSFVRSFLKTKVKEKLSRPALEALAIVAYKQPVSRGDIELVRGVNSDGVVLHLLDKGLIKIVGKKDSPGRPYLYGTAKLFLEYFGLKSLRDLPKLEDVSLLLANSPELDNNETQESIIGKSVESAAEATHALDQAEALAAGDSLVTQETSQEPAEMTQPVEQNNAEDISLEEIAVVTEEPQTLKQAMEDIGKGDLKSQEDFSEVDVNIVRE